MKQFSQTWSNQGSLQETPEEALMNTEVWMPLAIVLVSFGLAGVAEIIFLATAFLSDSFILREEIIEYRTASFCIIFLFLLKINRVRRCCKPLLRFFVLFLVFLGVLGLGEIVLLLLFSLGVFSTGLVLSGDVVNFWPVAFYTIFLFLLKVPRVWSVCDKFWEKLVGWI